jgi:DNA-directed RNA polymerase subunit RPC12/RpoP
MKNYICNFCGKDFQSKDQLRKHQEFELGTKHE